MSVFVTAIIGIVFLGAMDSPKGQIHIRALPHCLSAN